MEADHDKAMREGQVGTMPCNHAMSKSAAVYTESRFLLTWQNGAVSRTAMQSTGVRVLCYTCHSAGQAASASQTSA
jgi:hypothetical protein